jgi:hypothetical protein
MLVNAAWSMKAKEETCSKFSTLTPDQIDQTLLAKTCGVQAGQPESIEFTNLVDATMRKLPHGNMASSSARQSVLAIFKQVRLTMLDEMSMASENLLVSLERTLHLRQNFDEASPHGGFHITFSGDFCQLAPVGQDTVFNDECLRQWSVFVNCCMELKGMLRFKEDPEWGNFLSRFCQGCPTHTDFDVINQRVAIN